MRLKKIIIAAGFCATSVVPVCSVAAGNNYSITSEQSQTVKKFVIDNIKSIFDSQNQVTVGSIVSQSNGDYILSNILVIGGKDVPTISIKTLTLEGFKIGSSISGDFEISAKDIYVTGISKVLTANEDVNNVATSNNGEVFVKAFGDTLSRTKYTMLIKYNNTNKTLEHKLSSTNANTPFVNIDSVNTDADLQGVGVNEVFMQNVNTKMQQSKIKNFSMSLDLSNILRSVLAVSPLSKYADNANLKIKSDYNNKPGVLNLSAAANIGKVNNFSYNLKLNHFNISNIKLVDLAKQSNLETVFKKAYVTSVNSQANLYLNSNDPELKNNAFLMMGLSYLGKTSADLSIKSSSSFVNNSGAYNVNIKSNGLADFNISSKLKSDGDINTWTYFSQGVSDDSMNLYDCKHQMCITAFNSSFENHGLLEVIARMTNQDPNTTPSQILGSYGAILQLFAAQQQDPFLRMVMSSFAPFVTNPKSISISGVAKKPLNQTVLAKLIVDDVNSISENNNISGGRVNLSSNNNMKIIDKLQNIFALKFDVNK